jgi:hypothetical protein
MPEAGDTSAHDASLRAVQLQPDVADTTNWYVPAAAAIDAGIPVTEVEEHADGAGEGLGEGDGAGDGEGTGDGPVTDDDVELPQAALSSPHESTTARNVIDRDMAQP